MRAIEQGERKESVHVNRAAVLAIVPRRPLRDVRRLKEREGSRVSIESNNTREEGRRNSQDTESTVAVVESIDTESEDGSAKTRSRVRSAN